MVWSPSGMYLTDSLLLSLVFPRLARGALDTELCRGERKERNNDDDEMMCHYRIPKSGCVVE